MSNANTERWRTPLVVTAWTLLPACISAILGSHVIDEELRKVVYTGAGTLFFGGFFGGMLKAFLDEIVASKKRKDDAAGFVGNVLSDLKGVYDRVDRARLVIPAHRSVKTYGDEMRDLIEACVQLRNVVRALERRPDGVDKRVRSELVGHVRGMERYLAQLTSEFRDNYKRVSDAQRADEEVAKKVLVDYAAGGRKEPPSLPGLAWHGVAQLEHLAEFIQESAPRYHSQFVEPLDEASALLRDELARILGPHEVPHRVARTHQLQPSASPTPAAALPPP